MDIQSGYYEAGIVLFWLLFAYLFMDKFLFRGELGEICFGKMRSCKRMSPILAELEEEHTDIKVSKLNIKFGADTARKYNVMSSPTIVFFKDGEEVNRIKGVAKKADLEAIIKEIV